MTLRLSTLLLAALPVLTAPTAFAADHAHWSYQGHGDAKHWGELEPGFKTCAIGRQQSPINIETSKVDASAPLAPIEFSYAAGDAEIVNNGHTVQVNLKAPGSIAIEGTRYNLLQFHFHSPSEEKIDGKAFPLVAHLVHKSESGQLAVVAVLFKQGKENQALKEVFANLPARKGESAALAGGVDPAAVLPQDRSRYAFMGSLTTPPCSEEVRWQVLRTPVEASASQLKAFRKLYAMNARPVQPVNGRSIQLGQ